MNAVCLRTAEAFVDYDTMKEISSRAPRQIKPMSVGIMTRCPLTAWLIGFAPGAQELAILILPIALVLNMVTKTWLFSIKPVPLIAYFVKIGTIAVRH